MSVEPFRVQVPQSVLDDLAERLARTHWPDQLAGSAWRLGTDLGFLQRLCEHWHAGFDWRAGSPAERPAPDTRQD